MVSDDLRIWLNHFEYHAEHPRRVPSGLPDHGSGQPNPRPGQSQQSQERGQRPPGGQKDGDEE